MAQGIIIKVMVHAPIREDYNHGGITMLVLMKGEVTGIPPVPPEKFFEMVVQQTDSLKDYLD
jgi:hypothetical protein